MMKQNISRLALSAIALLAVSCNDSFMDRQPQTEIGVSSYFNTEEDLKMYCYNLYDSRTSTTTRLMPGQTTRPRPTWWR